MAVRELGHAGVASGWRKAVADRLSPPVARRTPLETGDVRALLGVAFVAIAAVYVARTVRRALGR